MIFLDLLRSKYIGVGGIQVHALSVAILGSTLADLPPNSPASATLLDNSLRRLRDQHLLTDKSRVERSIQPALLEAVTSLYTDDEQAAGLNWRHLLRLWQSTIMTSAWLRRRSLAEIADRIVEMRARLSKQEPHVAADALRASVGAYLHLRPFALTSHDRCLNDSLALVHFLAFEGLFPQWVIGVRTHPFAAHSWVQSGTVVLNDLPERVRAYRPILVV